jgi:hypothetical protein
LSIAQSTGASWATGVDATAADEFDQDVAGRDSADDRILEADPSRIASTSMNT